MTHTQRTPATITVVGGAGRLGRHVVAEALRRGHTVHATMHHNRSLPDHPRLLTHTADVHDPATLDEPISASQTVVSCLGSAGQPRADVQQVAADVLTSVMTRVGRTRLVSVTGSGARLTDEILTADHHAKRHAMAAGAPHLLADGDAHLAILERTALSWTVIRVPFMTAATDTHYQLSNNAPPSTERIAYRQAAHAMLDLAATDAWNRSAPFVHAGVRAIAGETSRGFRTRVR